MKKKRFLRYKDWNIENTSRFLWNLFRNSLWNFSVNSVLIFGAFGIFLLSEASLIFFTSFNYNAYSRSFIPWLRRFTRSLGVSWLPNHLTALFYGQLSNHLSTILGFTVCLCQCWSGSYRVFNVISCSLLSYSPCRILEGIYFKGNQEPFLY